MLSYRLILGLVLLFSITELWAARDRPNIVLIMTDNHGAWTLGCYGNRDIRTPNIDRLAAEGTLFEEAYSSNPVCSPTRATWLTGLMPSQHGVHCFLRAGEWQMPPSEKSMLEELKSLPEVLKGEGYRCGLVGKWHLGKSLHPQEGLLDYWVTKPHGGSSTFYGAEVIEDGKVRKEPGYTTDFWTDHALKFLDQYHKEPFFLFLSYNGPYALSKLLLRDGKNRHASYYADKELPSFPREPMHPWQYHNKDYLNNPTSIRRVATEVSGVDDGVGRVMEHLTNLGLVENTLVIFTADQGWQGGQQGIWGMGDHTKPVHAYDGTMHIPLIFWRPGNVPPGVRRKEMVSNYDFFPTMLGYLGLERRGWGVNTPGHDFSPILKGRPVKWENKVYYEFESVRAVRTRDWKFIDRYGKGPDELYNLRRDPQERTNVVDDAFTVITREKLREDLADCFRTYSEKEYNLWQGGGSKVKLYTPEDFGREP